MSDHDDQTDPAAYLPPALFPIEDALVAELSGCTLDGAPWRDDALRLNQSLQASSPLPARHWLDQPPDATSSHGDHSLRPPADANLRLPDAVAAAGSQQEPAAAERSEPAATQREAAAWHEAGPSASDAARAVAVADLEAPLPTEEQWARCLKAWQLSYCLSLAQSGVKALACRAARCSPGSVTYHRGRSSDFDRCCREAESMALDLVQAAVTVSATVGDRQPVFQGGVLVGHKRVKSIKAAELLLVGRHEAFPAPGGSSQAASSGSSSAATVPLDQLPGLVTGLIEGLFGVRRQQERLAAGGAAGGG